MNDAFGQPQSAIVLGGTSDIALAIINALATTRLERVVLAGRNQTMLDQAATEVRKAGVGEVTTVLFDAADVDGATKAVAQSFAAVGGRCDLVLVALGLLGNQSADENDAVATANLFTVNVTWPAAALAAMRERLVGQGQGRVLVLSSVAGVRVRRANFTYGSTKAAIDAYTQGFAESLRGTGVVVQSVRPGFVATKMTTGVKPAPFSTTPEKVAAGVVAGLSTDAPVIWTPKILRLVFLLFSHLPRAVWRRLPG